MWVSPHAGGGIRQSEPHANSLGQAARLALRLFRCGGPTFHVRPPIAHRVATRPGASAARPPAPPRLAALPAIAPGETSAFGPGSALGYPKHVEALYGSLPETKRDEIERRNAKAAGTPK